MFLAEPVADFGAVALTSFTFYRQFRRSMRELEGAEANWGAVKKIFNAKIKGEGKPLSFYFYAWPPLPSALSRGTAS